MCRREKSHYEEFQVFWVYNFIIHSFVLIEKCGISVNGPIRRIFDGRHFHDLTRTHDVELSDHANVNHQISFLSPYHDSCGFSV